MVQLSGKCFWYWEEFYSFLQTCGVTPAHYQRYPKDSFSKYAVMRNILGDLEAAGKLDAIQKIVSEFFRLSEPSKSENPSYPEAKILLEEFKKTVGNDPIDREIERRDAEQRAAAGKHKVQSVVEKNKKLEVLSGEFSALLTSSDHQSRGYAIERIFFELLDLEEFSSVRPYRTSSEQIDGHFVYEKFDYLVEIKWVQGRCNQETLSIFDGKIKRKAQSTRGFFLAVNDFDMESINHWKGDSPRIILMNGAELAPIFQGYSTFYDLLQRKVEKLVRYGDMF